MKFTPKSETELTRFAALPDGDYPFTVLESAEQISKSAKNAGRPMGKLKLKQEQLLSSNGLSATRMHLHFCLEVELKTTTSSLLRFAKYLIDQQKQLRR